MKLKRRNFSANLPIDRRERDTMLAALRFWQSPKNAKRKHIEHAYAIANDFSKELSRDEIDNFCDKLNYLG